MFSKGIVMYLRTFLILPIFLNSCCNGQQPIAKEKDPIREFFHLAEDAPYDLVEINRPPKVRTAWFGRAMEPGTRIRIRPFGKNVDLWLHPRDSSLLSERTPVYFSYHSADNVAGVNIVQQPPALMQGIAKFMEDPRYLASFFVGTDEYGRPTYNGYIGSKNLFVGSLPKSVTNHYSRRRRSIGLPDIPESKYHVVYRKSDRLEERAIAAANGTIVQQRSVRSPKPVPFLLFPKILLVVDHSVYLKFNKDVNRLLEYIAIFANGVDLKYREIEAPRIRLHISGIVICQEPDAAPYISKLMLGKDVFDGNKAMVVSKTFFYDIRQFIPLDSYDVAMTLTKLKFGLKGESQVLGKSWLGSMCKPGKFNDTKEGVVLVRYDKAFASVHFAAHELGHAFGMKDEGSEPEECNFKKGFIMSLTPWYTSNSSSWSPCSIKSLQEEIDQGNLECTYRKPHYSGRILPKILPGMAVDLQAQCVNLKYHQPCSFEGMEDICVNYGCQKIGEECIETGTAALEGTRCSGEDEKVARHCIHNKCVPV